MKLGVKLITGFLVVALILVAVAGVSMLLGHQAESAQKEADNEMEELHSINELQNGLYQEQTQTIKYLTIDDPTQAAAILENKEDLCEENEESFDELMSEFEEEDEYVAQMNNIQTNMDELDEAFENAREQKDVGELGEGAWIVALDDEYNYMIHGNGTNDTVGLDYMISLLDQNLFELEDSYSFVEEFYVGSMDMVSQLMLDAQMAAVLAISTDNVTFMTENATVFATNIATAQFINEQLVNELLSMESFEGRDDMIYGFVASNDTMTGMVGVFNQYIAMPGQNQTETINNLHNLFTTFRMIYGGLIANGEEVLTNWNEQIILDMAERSDLNLLKVSLSNEYSLGIKFLLESNAIKASEILEEKEIICEASEDLMENLTGRFQARNDFFMFANNTELHMQLVALLNYTIEGMENQDEITEDAMAVKEAGTLALSTTINDLDALLEECMVGNGSDDEEGFDFVTASIKEESEESKAEASDARVTATIITLAGVIIAISIAVVLGIVISRAISKPVVGMTEAAKKIREGNLDISVDEKGSDEIAELGKAFNQMILSVRLVAGEMGMETPAGGQDVDPELTTGEPKGPSPASMDK